MPKNKNTKSANKADLLVLLLCLAGMAVCLALFRQDMYSTLGRLNVKPVGTVVLKRRIAQRRFENRVLWDRLQKTTPVYAGDFIRTAENSEAAITMNGDDAVTSLGENTIIRITTAKRTGESRIELMGGKVSITAGSGGTVLVSGKNTLVLSAGSTVSAVMGKEPEMVLAAGAGASDGALNESPNRTVSAASLPPPRLLLPAEGTIFPGADSPAEISFRWVNGDENFIVALYILELADNPAIKNPALTTRVTGNRIALPKPETGLWYWRVTPVYAESSAAAQPSLTASFSIGETASGPQPAALQNTVTQTTGEMSHAVPIEVIPVEAVPAPAVVVQPAAPKPAAAQPVPAKPAAQPAAAKSVSAEKPAAAKNVQQDAVKPAAVKPAVPEPLPLPQDLSPANGYVLGPSQLKTNRSVTFNWNSVPGADSYLFSLYRITNGSRQLIDSKESAGTAYVFEKLSLLERGAFIWTVQALRKGETASRGRTAESNFTVDIPELQRHELPQTGNLYGN